MERPVHDILLTYRNPVDTCKEVLMCAAATSSFSAPIPASRNKTMSWVESEQSFWRRLSSEMHNTFYFQVSFSNNGYQIYTFWLCGSHPPPHKRETLISVVPTYERKWDNGGGLRSTITCRDLLVVWSKLPGNHKRPKSHMQLPSIHLHGSRSTS